MIIIYIQQVNIDYLQMTQVTLDLYYLVNPATVIYNRVARTSISVIL